MRFWDLLALKYLALYYFIEVPIDICFRAAKRNGLWYSILGTFVDAILWVDIVINFFRSYVDEHSVVVEDKMLIRRHYLSTSFPLDLVTAFPFNLLVKPDGVLRRHGDWLRIFKMLRLNRYLSWKHKTVSSGVQSPEEFIW